MTSMNTRLNIEKLDGNIVQKHGAQGDRKAEVFQVSNDDTAVAQRQLEDKQPEEKTNTACWVKEQKKEYQTGWKIKTSNVLTLVIRDSSVQDMLGFFGWLAIKQEMLEPVKVKCIFLGYRKRNMGFNESGEYKKTFIGSGVGTGSMQVLHEFEFKGATLSMGTIQYREDNNEAAFAVAVVEKIYAHESLTFNDTVACEVISKWKARLKDDMDARSNVYVLSNGCKKCSDDSDGYYWESTPGKYTLYRDHQGLEWECDLEKNGKWSCRYAVRSQEYQMVYIRLDIASTDVGMLDKFYHGLQTGVQVFVDFDYAMAAYMTLTGIWKKEIWLKGLLAESRYELSLVAGITTGTLVKGGSRSEVPAQVEGAAYRY
ncbi:hypothetical protein Tco_0478928 [Tanacetum coccineum]